jgi:hypothetical protein
MIVCSIYFNTSTTLIDILFQVSFTNLNVTLFAYNAYMYCIVYISIISPLLVNYMCGTMNNETTLQMFSTVFASWQD